MTIALLAFFSLMLIDCLTLYSWPEYYRAVLDRIGNCSRRVAAIGTLFLVPLGFVCISIAVDTETAQSKYLGCVGGFVLIAMGLTLAIRACFSEFLWRKLSERVAGLPASLIKKRAVVGFVINIAAIGCLFMFADF
ncbi:MAG: hypothetical protein OXC81_07740 [Betaproteobacteria bacterium]|nr:hypothetical protein [Betaproteobacteria bacterium]